MSTPSKGLMQTIEPSFMDPLKNMTAAVNYVRSEYEGTWTADGKGNWINSDGVEMVVRPRQNGKTTAIERACAISETVKPAAGGGWLDEAARPEMADIMERAMASMPSYADGGIVPSPTGRIWVSPGEHIMTAEMARAAADRALARMGGDYYTPEERAAMDDVIRSAFEEPPDDYPDPPQLPCW